LLFVNACSSFSQKKMWVMRRFLALLRKVKTIAGGWLSWGKLNITATCNLLGTGKWIPAEYTHPLNDAARVVVIADNDVSGRKHAHRRVQNPSTTNGRLASPFGGNHCRACSSNQ